MLDLNDPLWSKLDDAYGLGGVNLTLAELVEAWDGEAANEFFWSDLCHQGTVYAATYAAVPHLLAIAEPDAALRQRGEIAFFLGMVALSALAEPGSLPGLPETIEEWESKRDPYRYLVDHSDHADTYRSYLAVPVPTEDELATIVSLGLDFRDCVPAIRRLGERSLRESSDPDLFPYLLSGIAACDGLSDLASLLSFGAEGAMACPACGVCYEYASFDDRMVVYVQDDRVDRAVLDYTDGSPTRADGVVTPLTSADSCPDAATRAVYRLAEETDQVLGMVQNLLGRFDCVRCGARVPLAP